MTCCNKNPITIYQGFPTKWNDESLLTITFDSEIILDGFGAEFTIGEIVKTYTNIEEGFEINLSAQETGTLPLGAITGTLVIIDTENNKRPFSTELPFMVKDWADGDIKLDGFDVSINAKIQENKLTIRIESANPGAATEEMIKRYIAEHNQSEEAHPYIQGLIEAEQERAETEEAKKVDKVSSVNRVYGTDGNGNQTTYPVDGFGKVDDVQVGGVSVVQNKIASLGTMASETASDYRKASNQDIIDSGLSDRIGTLESYTPDTATSSNKFAVESEITNLQDTKQDNIDDLETIRSNATAGKSASDTIATYGNIVTHNVSEFATSAQGAKADTAIQPGDNITELVNNADYQTGSQVNTAISNHNTSESAHSYIQGLISSEKSRAEGVEGSLSSLTTDVKNNLVSAINEVDSHADTNASDISDIKDLIPNDASSSNQLADKNFVNSSISTNTANFIGTFNSVAELEAYSGTLTNNDYAFVVGTDTAGNTVYDRYKYTDATTPASWVFEYELNNSSFTADQWAAINSLATSSKIAQITTNQNAIGTLSSLTTTTKTDLVSAINELDSNKLAKNSAITGATKCKITYDGKGLVTGGADLSASDIPSLTLSKISDITATASELNVLDGITASTTELNYTDGVTSSIQTQLDNKVPTSRTVNGKALSSDISLTASDVGALPDSTVIPTINTTNNYVPYRSGASTLSNSSLLFNTNAMAFTGRLHVGSSSPSNYYNKGRFTIYDNTPSQQVSSMALLNYGGGGGCGVAIDMYNTSANGGIPSGRFGLVDNGNYSGYLQLQVKKSGAQSNPLLPAMNIVPVPAANSLTTCISFGQDEFNRVLFDLHKPEATTTITDTDKRWGGSGTTYQVTGSNKFNPRLLVAVGDIVSFDSFATEATVTGVVSNSTTCQITTNVSLGTISNKNISVKKAYFKITDENNNIKVYIDPYGKMGIGTGTPTYDLDVNGTINASTDVKVNGSSVALDSDIPTQASDVNALPDTTKYGADLSYSSSTLQLLDQDGNALGNPVTISSGSSLPSQTGHSGEFLTTDGTDASWSAINALQNTATGSDSLTVLGTAATTDQSVNIGYSSSTKGYSVAIGYGATTRSANSVAIGCVAETTSSNAVAIGEQSYATSRHAIAIGQGAQSYGSYSVQLGGGINNDDNTFCVATSANNNWKMLGSDGIIPQARLATGGTNGQVLTTNGTTASWTTISQMTATYDSTNERITFA